MLKTVPFLIKKVYYFASVACLGLIGWAIGHFGETNLPPLIPVVRYVILALYANCFLSYIIFVSDRGIETEKPSGWIWLAIIGAFLSLMHPVYSGDLMEYLIRGRMLAIYHVSPYRFVPNDFPNDILRPYSIWVSNPDSYGPLSVYLQTLPAALFQSSITGMVWAYKMIVLAFLWVAVWFFWKIVRQLDLPGGARLWAMFAYCPLIVVTAFIDGHNDVIMMSLSLISLYFLSQNKYGRAFFFWTLGFLVKYMIVLQLPFMVLVAVKKLWSEKKTFPWLFVMRQLVFNVLVIVAFFWPVWGGEKTFLAILRQKDAFYTNTVPYLFYMFSVFLKWPIDQQILKIFFLSSFGLLYFYWMWRCWNKVETVSIEFFRIVSLVYLAFYATLPSPIGYWYLAWGIFWIILARWPKDLTLVVLYSLVGVLAFYKRPNFLAAGAALIYLFLLGAQHRFGRALEK